MTASKLKIGDVVTNDSDLLAGDVVSTDWSGEQEYGTVIGRDTEGLIRVRWNAEPDHEGVLIDPLFGVVKLARRGPQL